MQTTLDLHLLDEALFPELEHPPGVYSIEPAVVRAGADQRVPIPKGSPAALLVSYTLLASAVPPGSAWHLETSRVMPNGSVRQVLIGLVEPPPPGSDNVHRITPDPSLRVDPGTVYRQVFWVDLGPPLASGLLIPQDRMTLRFGTASAVFVLA